MSFTARELSLYNGMPLRLYLFERGAMHRWAYTSADREILWQGNRYAAKAITDDGIRMTGQASADTLKITGPADLAPAALYRAAPPGDEVFLTIRDYHYGEADVPASAQVAWIGSISAVRWPQRDRCEIVCDSLSASMQRTGLRLTYERSCPHTLYDTACGVNRDLYKTTATITALDGARITCALADGSIYAGGYVEWDTAGGARDRRGIEAATGGVLTLLGGTFGLRLGQAITLYQGCDQSSATCSGRFGNMDNYGGYRHMPGKSPFDGTPVF